MSTNDENIKSLPDHIQHNDHNQDDSDDKIILKAYQFTVYDDTLPESIQDRLDAN
jgi:hypothetical protein